MWLVDKGSHHGVPDDIDDADHEEHHGHDSRVEPINVVIIKEQPDANGLVNQVLGQFARTKPDPLTPCEFVISVVCSFHSMVSGLSECN